MVWRIIGIIVLGLITWIYTKNVEVTTIVTVLFHSIRFCLYYLHERVWDGIEWGLLKKSELNPKEQEIITERLKKLGYIE